jgi:trans-2,3-dihydro-3-hydroxyanthranilate isomerase
MARAVGVHLYAHVREHGVEIQSRMFAPLFGVPEDPATGSSNVVLIGLLAHFRPEADLELSKTMGQGFDMGRPSILEGAATKKAGRVVDTYIGGRCVPMLAGTIDLT